MNVIVSFKPSELVREKNKFQNLMGLDLKQFLSNSYFIGLIE